MDLLHMIQECLQNCRHSKRWWRENCSCFRERGKKLVQYIMTGMASLETNFPQSLMHTNEGRWKERPFDLHPPV
jgi:hypothetical protein